ncbi:MAG: alpha/beta hydrolase, partial [Planctomycetes bacterium]|nr:alpha/beta hydrolase [Planctomycetota bacterium]
APRRLHEVLAPTEVVHGSRDLLVPLALARAAAERLPRARLTVLDGVGHMPWLEAPRELAARVQVARQRAAHDHPSTPTGDA